MARTRPNAAMNDEADAPIDPIEAQHDELEGEILAALDASNEDVRFKLSVCKIDDKGDEWRVGTYPPTAQLDALLDEVAQKNGTGTYRFRLYRNGVICKNVTRNLIAPPAPVMQQMPVGTDIANAIGSALKEPMSLIATLIAKLGDKPSQAQTPVTDLVAALGTLDSIRNRGANTAPAAPALGVKDMLDLVKQGMDIAKESQGGGETSFMDLFKTILEKVDLKELATAYASQPPNAPALSPPAQPASQANGATPAPTQQPQQQLTPEQQLAGMLKHNMRYLITKAVQDADPELYAEWAYDNIPVDVLKGIATQPNAIELLQGIEPAVGAHADWFMEVLQHVNSILTEQAKEAQSEGSPSGQPNVPTAAPANSSATG